jgi:glutamyl-tRNA synthetase
VAAIENVLPHVAGGGEIAAKLTPDLRAKLMAAMPGLKERAKTLVDLIDSAGYLWADRPIAPDDKARQLLTDEARALLGDMLGELEPLERWSAETTEAAVRTFAERKGVKLGAVAQPLRAALTGRTTSPGIFDVLEVLGRAESLDRLRDQAAVPAH